MIKRVLSTVLLFCALFVILGVQNSAQDTHAAYLPLLEVEQVLRHGVGVHREYWDCAGLQALGVTAALNWTYPPYCPGVQAIGMQWGKEAVRPAPEHITIILGYNEPDSPKQADMRERAGAIKWHDEVEVVHADKLLGSPATTQDGIGWLLRWRDEYVALYGHGPRVDYVVLHCYGTCGDEGNGARDCRQYVQDQYYLIELFGARGIIVAEFAYPTCWEGEQRTIDEMRELVRFFAGEREVVAWFWFIDRMTGNEAWWWDPDCRTQLRDFDTGELTALGEAYRSLGWELGADINGDRQVDILDGAIWGASFGRGY